MNQNIRTMLDKSEVKLDLLYMFYDEYIPYWWDHKTKTVKSPKKK